MVITFKRDRRRTGIRCPKIRTGKKPDHPRLIQMGPNRIDDDVATSSSITLHPTTPSIPYHLHLHTHHVHLSNPTPKNCLLLPTGQTLPSSRSILPPTTLQNHSEAHFLHRHAHFDRIGTHLPCERHADTRRRSARGYYFYSSSFHFSGVSTLPPSSAIVDRHSQDKNMSPLA